MPTPKNITLSDQALGAVMLALQNSLLTQTDIVPVLKGFNFVFDDTMAWLLPTRPFCVQMMGSLLQIRNRHAQIHLPLRAVRRRV